jgi:SAM-dependent methyltransferase
MTTKDYFSGHAKLYATFRPTYPVALYEFIYKNLKTAKSVAWDCATGNGQVAAQLSKDFEKVFATDISQNQLENAHQKRNIIYSVSPAEKTSFTDNQFDLITVGQALHWFNLDAFYREVKRVGKNDGLLAVWGYSVCSVNPEIDLLLLNFYNSVVGPYWDSARKLVDDHYASISFPFEEIASPEFQLRVEWTLDEFLGYLRTWSATQKYTQLNNHDPIPDFALTLKPWWKANERRKINFPVFLKLGIIKNEPGK